VSDVYLTRVDASQNMARYYRMTVQPTLFGEWSLIREWGRIGSGGQVKAVICSSQAEATGSLALFAKHKVRRGYQTVLATSSVSS
jgi:predicted DNA-binding WGR domain protein